MGKESITAIFTVRKSLLISANKNRAAQLVLQSVCPFAHPTAAQTLRFTDVDLLSQVYSIYYRAIYRDVVKSCTTVGT